MVGWAHIPCHRYSWKAFCWLLTDRVQYTVHISKTVERRLVERRAVESDEIAKSENKILNMLASLHLIQLPM